MRVQGGRGKGAERGEGRERAVLEGARGWRGGAGRVGVAGCVVGVDFQQNKYTTNPSAIVALIVLTIINSLVEYMNKCSNIGGIVMGILIGGIIGLIWYFLIINSGYKNLAYFSEIVSNNIMCSKPSEQFYQCTYYRNGIKISDEDMNRIFTT